MRLHPVQLLLVAGALFTPAALACASRSIPPPVVTAAGDTELEQIAAAVNKALDSPPPRGYVSIPKDVRLLSVDRRRDGSIALDFSEELLVNASDRTLEDAVRQILTAAASARTPQPGRQDDLTLLVNGVTLDAYRP